MISIGKCTPIEIHIKTQGGRSMKKCITVLLVFLMIVTAITSCSNTTEPISSTTQSESEPQEPLEINWLVSNIEGYATKMDTETEKYIEERYNVNINVFEVDTYTADTWNIFWATSPKVDIVTCMNPDQDLKLITDGFIRSVPDGWLETYAPTWMNAVETAVGKDVVEKSVKVDGKTYFVPYTFPNIGRTICIRQDWLDKLDLPQPKTIDEFVNVLKAFTFNDPDGNSKNDTYGIDPADFPRGVFLNTIDKSWPGAFWTDTNGKVFFSSTDNNFKKNLKRWNAIYKLGVIDPEFATDTRAQTREKWATGKIGCLCDATSNLIFEQGQCQQLLNNDPNAKFYFLPAFESEDGNKYIWSPFVDCTSGGAFMFGTNCSDEVMQWFLEFKEDLMTDWDLFTKVAYGEEGTDYSYDADGVLVSEIDLQAAFEKGLSAGNASYFGSRMIVGTTDMKKLYDKDWQWCFTFNIDGCIPAYMNYDFLVQGQNEAYDKYFADVTSIADEYYYNAIAGRADIDTTWDNYISRLKEAHLDEILAGYQTMID